MSSYGEGNKGIYVSFVISALACLIAFALLRSHMAEVLALIYLLSLLPKVAYLQLRVKSKFGVFESFWLLVAVLLLAIIWLGFEIYTLWKLAVIPSNESLRNAGYLFFGLGFYWLFMARSLATDKMWKMRSLLREAEILPLFAAIVSFAALSFSWMAKAAVLLLLFWAVVVACEMMGRLVASLFVGKTNKEEHILALYSGARELLFGGSNPLRNITAWMEKASGIESRGKWVAAILREALFPLVLLILVVMWVLSGVRLVRGEELALKTEFGHKATNPIQPGLHLIAPWPFGTLDRFPVKRIQSVTLGFESIDKMERPAAILWTKEHSGSEFALVLGNGTELLAVNAIIYYKISEDAEGFSAYTLGWNNAEEALNGLAYAVLMANTRSATLEKILSEGRGEFARGIEREIQRRVLQAQLGIDILSVEIMSLHPPTQVAYSYLDVINARFEAQKALVVANGEVFSAAERAHAQQSSLIADATAAGLKRSSLAVEETSQFRALAIAAKNDLKAQEFRIKTQVMEENLVKQRLIVMDKDINSSGGEMWFDMRPTESAKVAVRPEEQNAKAKVE